MKQYLAILCGAVAGGLVGYFAFFWMAKQGFYALALPGALLGVGAGIVKNRSIYVALICGFSALALGLFIEWRFAPFIENAGFGYFLTHIHQLKPVTLIMILLGGVIGAYIPFRRHAKD